MVTRVKGSLSGRFFRGTICKGKDPLVVCRVSVASSSRASVVGVRDARGIERLLASFSCEVMAQDAHPNKMSPMSFFMLDSIALFLIAFFWKLFKTYAL